MLNKEDQHSNSAHHPTRLGIIAFNTNEDMMIHPRTSGLIGQHSPQGFFGTRNNFNLFTTDKDKYRMERTDQGLGASELGHDDLDHSMLKKYTPYDFPHSKRSYNNIQEALGPKPENEVYFSANQIRAGLNDPMNLNQNLAQLNSMNMSLGSRLNHNFGGG